MKKKSVAFPSFSILYLRLLVENEEGRYKVIFLSQETQAYVIIAVLRPCWLRQVVLIFEQVLQAPPDPSISINCRQTAWVG